MKKRLTRKQAEKKSVKITAIQVKKKIKRGYSHAWISRYREMLSGWELIKVTPALSDDFKKGFKYCMDIFIRTKGDL